MSDIPLLLFAKAPIAGKVKTRLQTNCSAFQAAEIAKILLEQSIIKAKAAWPGKVLLSVWLDHEHSFIQHMVDTYSVELVHQVDGDLGVKMRDALSRFGFPAAVMGCDAPHVSSEALLSAHSILDRGESVIGPSEDGGYYLLGLQDDQPSLFENITWGADTVLTTTLSRAEQAKLAIIQLAALNDVDEWDDLIAVAQLAPELKNYLLIQKLVGK